MDDQEAKTVIEVLKSGHDNPNPINGGVTKAVAIITGVAALVLMVRGQIVPQSQRIDSIENRLERIEQRRIAPHHVMA